MIKKLVELPQKEWDRLSQKYTIHNGRFSGITFLKYNLGFNSIVTNLSRGQRKKLLLLLFKNFFKLDSAQANKLAEVTREHNTKIASFLSWYSSATADVEVEQAVEID